jgi:hypothetical protein
MPSMQQQARGKEEEEERNLTTAAENLEIIHEILQNERESDRLGYAGAAATAEEF